MHLVLLSLLACSASSPDDSANPSGPGDGGGGGWATTDGGSAGDGGGGWSTQPAQDSDGDGYTVEDGDCDDGDGLVHPGGDDSICDGKDGDCDDEVDEDFDRDEYEPNDDSGVNLGTLAEDESALMLAWLWPEADQDRYRFYVEDGDWSWFDIELWLYDVPEGADYALELWQVEDADGDYVGLVDSADDEADGGEELVNYGGSSGFDDSGWYEAVVRSNDGAACDVAYTLQVLVGSWR